MDGTGELRTLLEGPVLDVAPRLLGAVLRRGEVAVRLTEVEAYDGPNDPGSHAYRGMTQRNAVMFGPAGHLYVYFTYGMHYCCNVACGPEGRASAVLLRAGEVIAGHDVVRQRRPRSTDRDLARGPARLCQALAIDRADDGADLACGPIRLEPDEVAAAARIRTGPRVGLRAAADRPWRFWLDGEPSVSRYVAAKPRPRRS
ncbi:MAG TPA: DNA-3-methyladenine glycosylase [Marmoricola sp.]|nr:DNA-3-methyladenine glycosylase [Marmoricola sp.]